MKKGLQTFWIIAILLLASTQTYAQCCNYTYQQQIEPVTSAATFGVGLGDFDGDGDQDAVSIGAYYGVDVFFNNGSGIFTLNAQYATGTNGDFYGVNVADVDGDNDLDIIAIPFYTSASLTILINNGLGVFSVTTVSSNIAAYNAAIGDVDNDNDIDIFIPNKSGSSGKLFKNNGYGVFTLFQTITGAKGDDVELGDLDGDGDLDAFVTSNNSSASNSVFLNNGTGTFTQSGTSFSASGSNLDLGDLDGDGDLDAWIGLSSGGSEIWKNNGSAVFTLDTTVATGNYCKAVHLYDFDNDGDLDVFMSFYSSAPQIWTKTEMSGYGLCYQAPAGSSSHGMAIGFINNDNYIDMYSGYFSNNDGDYVFLNSSPSIQYSNTTYCYDDNNLQTCTLTGGTGGTFSSYPLGLDIDPLTGSFTPKNSAPNTYVVNYLVAGCNVSFTVAIRDVDVTTIISGDTITAHQDSAIYQWLDYNNSMLPISGATNQFYVADTTGDYAVIVSYNGCTDTSAAVHIFKDETGIENLDLNNSVAIYPNPVKEVLYVKQNKNFIGNTYEIHDLLGGKIMSGQLDSENVKIDVSKLSPGIYIMEINNGRKQNYKILKD
ncbi:MAG: T9SS type A sorting domain-containing protein [Saprospiraceae bacterium]|nr:T9SS type A sorting domain-containing protein [Saprospiraceae bacterium]